jgi:hypothetical protein
VSSSPDHVLAQARLYASQNRVRIDVYHALPRMSQRGVRRGDVLCALQTGTDCVPGNKAGRWKITGEDLDGEALSVVCVVEGDVLVVTVF